MLTNVFACVCLVAVVSASVSPVPALFWSGNDRVLLEGNTELPRSVSQSVIHDFVKFVVGSSSKAPEELSHVVSQSSNKPEITLIFLHPELDTAQVTSFSHAFQPQSDGGSFKNLKEFMSTSMASLSLPYVFKTADLTLLTNLEKMDQVHIVDAIDAPAFLHLKQSMYHDNKADVVVVRFADTKFTKDALAAKLRKDDELMAQITHKAFSETKGNTLCLLTSLSPPSTSTSAPASFTKSASNLIQLKQSSSSDDTPLYMTPGVLSGLLVGSLLFMISSVGVFGLMALETPDSWESEGGFLAGPSGNGL